MCAFECACMCVCVCAPLCLGICMCAHACVCMRLCMCACTPVCIHAHACVCLCVRMRMRVSVCVCVCLCVCLTADAAVVCMTLCWSILCRKILQRMCCCCSSLSVERAGASMVPGLATMPEPCFNTQCAACTCTVRSMPHEQSKPTRTAFLKGPMKSNFCASRTTD